MDLSLARVFQSPTVASLAEIVDLERSALGLPPTTPPKQEVNESPAIKHVERRQTQSLLASLSSRALGGEAQAGSWPLSYNQESMFVMFRTDPGR